MADSWIGPPGPMPASHFDFLLAGRGCSIGVSSSFCRRKKFPGRPIGGNSPGGMSCNFSIDEVVL